MQKVVISELFSKIIITIILIILSNYHANLYLFVATIPITALFIFIFKFIISRKDVRLKFGYDKPVFNNLIKMSIPLGIVFIVNNFYFKIDTLILSFIKGAAAVGIYSVAYRVLETTLFTGAYLTSSLKPLLSNSVHDDKAKTEKALHLGSAFLIFMALFLTISCVTFPNEIIIFLSNKSFAGGKHALFILGFVSIFLYLSGLMGEILIALDLRKILIRNSIIILSFNIILNLIAIPRYSYTGAAATTLISEITLFIISASFVRKHFKITFDWPRIAKLFFVAFISIILGYSLKNHLPFIINLLLILIFYTITAYYSDALPQEITKNFLKSIKTKLDLRKR